MSDDQKKIPINLEALLLPDETFVRGNFKEYFLHKRHNFIATIHNHQDLADLFFHLDQDWFNAINALSPVEKDEWILPVQLTNYCFRELRLSAELLLSGCTAPGNSHLRSALEAFTQAEKIIREPQSAAVWFAKEADPKEYDKQFRGKANLFPATAGLSGLHGIWQMLCNVGPHPNVSSVAASSTIRESEFEVEWALQYFEVRSEELTRNFLIMLSCSIEMFKHIYSSFHARLSLDELVLRRLHSHIGRFEQLRDMYGPSSHIIGG